MKKIAIIGAGISGLFIANLFRENPDYSLSIYEKNSPSKNHESKSPHIKIPRGTHFKSPCVPK